MPDTTLGAVVTGVKLAEISDQDFAELYKVWLDRALLVFPGQHLTDAEQIAFARRFGSLEIEMGVLTNLKDDGTVREDVNDDMVKVLKGNMHWHVDSTYMPVQSKGAVLSASVAPVEGGETEWADLRAGYDALDDATRAKIEHLSAHHSLKHSWAKLGYTESKDSSYNGYGLNETEVPLRPLVKVHPETGRRSLNVGRHAHAIPGLSPEASEELLDELQAITCQSPRTYRHRWKAGDVILWDNRATLHRVMPWDLSLARVMRHTRIAGDPVTEGWERAAA
ncbi:MAG: TauD/TfdA family dioxygenase [Proteobacteria bacterium]|nr:TauD/TfdA family dioxygenase [Pseudomonadota bacterium]